MTYDTANILASRIKPKQNRIELEVSLDTRNPNYSKSKGEQFALNVDGKSNIIQPNHQQQRYYKTNLMDKQLLVSSNGALGNMNKHYCCGLLKSNQLHLTPLEGVIQMRPSYEYFDIYEKKVKENKDTHTDTGLYYV
jgi:DNA-directed RNA polymerase-3 subunit RPC5